MDTRLVDTGGAMIACREDGARAGAPVLFLGEIATDMRVWDSVLPHLPDGLRLLRMDIRGHGASSAPPGPYSMGALVRDAERVMETCGMADAVVVGCGLGGMIAQGLAVKRLDLVRGLVLVNTAAKMGQPASWHTRADALRREGMEAFHRDPLPRWARAPVTGLREMVSAQPAHGVAACCDAIAGTDFYTPVSGLRLPTLGLAGTDDAFTPPDLVRETAELIPGAETRLLRRAGHVPMFDQPEAMGHEIGAFLIRIGHCGASVAQA